VELVGTRGDVAFAIEKFQISERRACELNGVDRSSYRYEPRPDHNRELRDKLVELARQKPRYGYRRLGVLLERQGDAVNHKRLWRVYQQAGLSVRRRERKRLERGKVGMPLLIRPNQEWSIDFVSDALANGRAIRALTVIDGFTKESPVIEVDSSLSAPRITRVLDQVIEQRGRPDSLRLDNGPEFTSRCFSAWAEQRGIALVFIQPGKPVQNSFIESFNGRFRDECLNANWFENLADARRKIEAWRQEYNQHRPHSALAYRTPEEFARAWSPSPSLIVIEQSGTPVKDSLSARKNRASLTGAPDCSTPTEMRAKGTTEGGYDLR
jgi:putative transposase